MEMKKLDMKRRVNLELRDRTPEKVRTNAWDAGKGRSFPRSRGFHPLAPPSCRKRAGTDARRRRRTRARGWGALSSRAAAGPVSFQPPVGFPPFYGLLSRALASQSRAFFCEAWRRSTSFSDFLSRFHVFSSAASISRTRGLLLPSVLP